MVKTKAKAAIIAKVGIIYSAFGDWVIGPSRFVSVLQASLSLSSGTPRKLVRHPSSGRSENPRRYPTDGCLNSMVNSKYFSKIYADNVKQFSYSLLNIVFFLTTAKTLCNNLFLTLLIII